VAVVVSEGARIDVIDDAFLPPMVVCHDESPHHTLRWSECKVRRSALAKRMTETQCLIAPELAIVHRLAATQILELGPEPRNKTKRRSWRRARAVAVRSVSW